ncbi:hypothetical protein NQK81_41315 [Amycolatopsis roodepoortensis]|uniref:hypothetical protein n=1 Tax=Amycolatopsis roodepoortensis TaxID=700274 RepID=UPI00214CCE87|nr:hypothetical protein [Amycolatopsis roodepoortensis]UUV31129.1 hypothetical protein NQK81_41315 [Amycolatopsis roodepoortensis]
MTSDANAYPQPQPDPVPMSHPSRRSRKLIFIVVGAVLAASIAAVLIIVTTASSPKSVNGTLYLLCDRQCTKATANGYDGYSDISDGSQVTLVDEAGQVIAITELRRAPDEKTSVIGGVWVRTFTFAFAEVPSADRYGVHVGNNNRGTLWKNSDEIEKSGFHLTIGG